MGLSPVSDNLTHQLYGDLRRGDCFVISPLNGHRFPIERRPLYIHLTATARCNARCAGCINSSVTFATDRGMGGMGEMVAGDTVPLRDATAISHLIERDGSDDVLVCFYGGEPLLAVDKLVAVMNELDKSTSANELRYMVYTNGTLLRAAHEKFPQLNESIWLYSVSIDGRSDQHNTARPGAALDDIHDGLRYLADSSDAEVLIWSTIREGQSVLDCYKEFEYLHNAGLADHFFWHFVEAGEPFVDLPGFAHRYERQLRAIMDSYTSSLAAGRLISIVHINELVLYMLTGHDRGSTACGVELARNYDIIGGRISACADLPDSYTLGYISPDGQLNLDESDLASLASYKHSLGCESCGVAAYCGGRCPVQALAAGMDRMRQYCVLMRLHVAVVGDYIESISQAIDSSGLSLQDIYDKSAFFAQFTDVTP